MASPTNKTMYSILRHLPPSKKYPKGVSIYLKHKGNRVFDYAAFAKITKQLRAKGLEKGDDKDYSIEYHLPKQPPKPKPVPEPKWEVNEASIARVNGSNAHRGIVLHSTEGHDRPGVSDIRGVNSYLRGKGYGIHIVVDGEGNQLKGANWSALVYHCKGANSTHVGIEMIGFARWTTKDWIWGPNKTKRKQLEAVAECLAYLCDHLDIPIKLDKHHGICTHAMWPEGGHWDPGKGFPLKYVMKRAKAIRASYRNPAA